MASVYLAVDRKLDRYVALKVMAVELLQDESFAERFVQEAKIAAGFSHRNIVNVYDVGSHGDLHYLAMEYLPGDDMSGRLKSGVSIPEALNYVKDVAAGLQYASDKNFIHRDIKPDNILFGEDGRAVISDFGIAKSLEADAGMTVAGSAIGTPRYMSPEQASAKPLDHRTDLYSLGVVVYEILAGAPPFKGDSAISVGAMHITQPPPELPEQFKAYQGFIDKALAKNPEDRFVNGNEMIAALELLEKHVGAEVNEATVVLSEQEIRNAVLGASAVSEPSKPQSAGSGGAYLKWAAALVLFVVLIGGGAYFTPILLNKLGSSEEASSGLEQQIEELFSLARRQFLEGKLDTPLGDNAKESYQKVLALDPNNFEARQALLALEQRKLEEAKKALESSRRQQPKVVVAQPKPQPKPQPAQPQAPAPQPNPQIKDSAGELSRMLASQPGFKDTARIEELMLSLEQESPGHEDALAARELLDNLYSEEVNHQISNRSFAKAGRVIEAWNPYVKENESYKLDVQESLNDVKALVKQADKLVQKANEAMDMAYSGPQGRHDRDERERFKSIHQTLLDAKDIDPNSPGVARAHKRLDNAYVAIISELETNKKIRLAIAWQSDAKSLLKLPLHRASSKEIDKDSGGRIQLGY